MKMVSGQLVHSDGRMTFLIKLVVLKSCRTIPLAGPVHTAVLGTSATRPERLRLHLLTDQGNAHRDGASHWRVVLGRPTLSEEMSTIGASIRWIRWPAAVVERLARWQWAWNLRWPTFLKQRSTIGRRTGNRRWPTFFVDTTTIRLCVEWIWWRLTVVLMTSGNFRWPTFVVDTTAIRLCVKWLWRGLTVACARSLQWSTII